MLPPGLMQVELCGGDWIMGSWHTLVGKPGWRRWGTRGIAQKNVHIFPSLHSWFLCCLPPCHELFLLYHVPLPCHPAMESADCGWNLYKLWTKINLSFLELCMLCLSDEKVTKMASFKLSLLFVSTNFSYTHAVSICLLQIHSHARILPMYKKGRETECYSTQHHPCTFSWSYRVKIPRTGNNPGLDLWFISSAISNSGTRHCIAICLLFYIFHIWNSIHQICVNFGFIGFCPSLMMIP